MAGPLCDSCADLFIKDGHSPVAQSCINGQQMWNPVVMVYIWFMWRFSGECRFLITSFKVLFVLVLFKVKQTLDSQGVFYGAVVLCSTSPKNKMICLKKLNLGLQNSLVDLLYTSCGLKKEAIKMHNDMMGSINSLWSWTLTKKTSK